MRAMMTKEKPIRCLQGDDERNGNEEMIFPQLQVWVIWRQQHAAQRASAYSVKYKN